MEASEYFQLLTRRALPVIVDDELVEGAVRALGFEVARFDTYDFAAPKECPALVVITQTASIERLHELWSRSATRFCHLALAKFDGSAKVCAYAFAQLLSADHAAALTRRAALYDRMLSCQDIEIVTAAGVLYCHMKDELEIPNPGTVIEPGWLYSIAEFFEASVVNLASERASFQVEGELDCDGGIYLCNSAELKQRYSPQLDKLLARVARGRAVVRFADNQLERILVGNEDLTASITMLTAGKERAAAVTELGFGCATFSGPPALDLNINMVLHKSCLGAYVGIGQGLHIPHIDFIARGAELRFTTASSAT